MRSCMFMYMYVCMWLKEEREREREREETCCYVLGVTEKKRGGKTQALLASCSLKDT